MKNVKILKNCLQPIHYLPNENGVSRVGPKFTFGRRYWIVPRSRCLFRSLETGDISFDERSKAVDLVILSWTPFVATGRYVISVAGRTMVWIWDDEQLCGELRLHKAENATVVPETVMRAGARQDEIDLITCIEGVEGRIWSAGLLVASRWWQKVPEKKQWFQFYLKHELPPSENVPNPLETEVLAQPWAKNSTNYKAYFKRNEYGVVGILVACLMLYMVWLGATAYKLHNAKNQLQVVVEQKMDRISPVLAFRDRATGGLERLNMLRSLVPFPSQLEIISSVVAVLPTDATIVKWSYISGSVTMKIQGTNPDPQVIIEKLEKKNLFVDINAERSSRAGQLDVKMQVKKSSKP